VRYDFWSDCVIFAHWLLKRNVEIVCDER